MSERSDVQDYHRYVRTKKEKLSRPALDCGCRTYAGQSTAGHIWCNRVACMDHADDPHDCTAYGGLGEEKPRESASTAADEPPLSPSVMSESEFVNILTVTPQRTWPVHPASPFLTREELCGPDPAVEAFREEVRRQGLDESTIQVEALRPRSWSEFAATLPYEEGDRLHVEGFGDFTVVAVDQDDTRVHLQVAPEPTWEPVTDIEAGCAEPRAQVTEATPEETAAHDHLMHTRSLECSRSTPMCSGCDGAAAWGWSPCLHECHQSEMSECGDDSNIRRPEPEADQLLDDILTVIRAGDERTEEALAAAPRRPWWRRWLPWR